MANFFEKLKKGMGIEGNEEIQKEEEKKEEKREGKKKIQSKTPKIKRAEKLEIKAEPIEKEVLIKNKEEEEKKWLQPEGQLAIDVYQTETELVIQSAIAGVRPENLDIFLERDVLTIKGVREKPFEEEGDYFTQECYWGPFSREVILPVEIDPDRVTAQMKDGILTVRLPKILRERKRRIKVKI